MFAFCLIKSLRLLPFVTSFLTLSGFDPFAISWISIIHRFEFTAYGSAIMTEAKKDVHVGIVGAGIGGLTAAIAIARAGAKVTVLEAAEELGEVRFSFPLSQFSNTLSIPSIT